MNSKMIRIFFDFDRQRVTEEGQMKPNLQKIVIKLFSFLFFTSGSVRLYRAFLVLFNLTGRLVII